MLKIRLLLMVSAMAFVFGCGPSNSATKLDTTEIPPADPNAADFSEDDLPKVDGNI